MGFLIGVAEVIWSRLEWSGLEWTGVDWSGLAKNGLEDALSLQKLKVAGVPPAAKERKGMISAVSTPLIAMMNHWT